MSAVYQYRMETGEPIRQCVRLANVFLCAILLMLFTSRLTFAQSPSLTVTPPVAVAGGEVSLVGFGYTAGQHEGQILWDDQPVGSLTIDANGGFSPVPFIIPISTNEGTHRITVCDENPCDTRYPGDTVTIQVTESNPIRVCLETADPCGTFANEATVTVHRIRPGAADQTHTVAANEVQDRDQILQGDQLWVTVVAEQRRRFTVYYTSGDAVEVNDKAFETPIGVPDMMTIVVTEQKPLIVHDLMVSTQWTLNASERRILGGNLRKASNYLYDFTDGQFVFGEITVYQDYQMWEDVDFWLYANNNLRPKATAGGIVPTKFEDPTFNVVYYPGYIHMGSAWNRYNRPPNEDIIIDGVPIDSNTLLNDWSQAFAHENGHYLFFLFDTYIGVGPDQTAVNVYSCTGSAMGWVYEPENWGYIGDPNHWQTNCKGTHAYSLMQREEWATMKIHYPWLVTPATLVEGPSSPPVNLTNVTFVGPNATGDIPLINLNYKAGETAGRRAKGYLFHNDRVIGQGNAPLGKTELHLTGAQAGDRLCVFDIDPTPPEPHTSRHQFGCETLEAGDTDLEMRRDLSWAPIVLLTPVSEASIAISVTAPVTNAEISATFYPEHKTGSSTIVLAQDGPTFSGIFSLTESTPSAFVQVFVNEPATESAPRREAMAAYGVDGGTVPGPSRCEEKAPVYSPDGESEAWPVVPVDLEPGQFIALQTMVASYPIPPGATQVSDAYRIISWPPSLAESFVVTVDFSGVPGTSQVAAAGANAEQPAAIYYWTGNSWTPAATTITESHSGEYTASAVIPNGSIYTLLGTAGIVEVDTSSIYLPAVARK